MSLRALLCLLTASWVIGSGPVSAAPQLIPPVDATVIVPFMEPPHRWGPGHRGVDLSVPSGTQVRAAGTGTVTFAGSVAGHLAVTVAHGDGYETTYSALSEVSVVAGQTVAQGEPIGLSGEPHPGGGVAGVHFGVKLDKSYVDPAELLGALGVSQAIRLAPLVWQPPREMPDAFRSAFADAGTAEQPCRPATRLDELPAIAPNDNVAVAIAGIGSSTRGGMSADMYEHGPEELGYGHDRIVRFSYAGLDEDLHRPYRSTDTFGDIESAARRLGETLREVARRHPGRKIDLIAHSLGGLVARTYLARLAREPGQPQIEHLVTFASPHSGASIASLTGKLETNTLSGGALVDGASLWARHGGPIPDPRSAAVRQLAPGSAFLEGLSRESVVYGVRTLALGIANDVVVTADRARWDQARSRTISPEGLMGHSAIVGSDEAQGLAYAFLRDAAPTCETAWDLWGPRIGRATGFVEANSYRALAAAEAATLGRVAPVGKAVVRYVPDRLGDVARKLVGRAVPRVAVEAVGRDR